GRAHQDSPRRHLRASGMTRVVSDAANVDSREAERGRPALLEWCLEDDGRIRRNGQPSVAGELRLELPAAPARVAERHERRIGTVAIADRCEDIRRRSELDLGADG